MVSQSTRFRRLSNKSQILLSTLTFLTTATFATATPAAFAATTSQNVSITANIQPGTLTLSPPGLPDPFPGFLLNGLIQHNYATLSNWTVTDATGTGDGWNIEVSSTQFKELPPQAGFPTGYTPLTLPLDSLSGSSSLTFVAQPGSTPVSSTGGPYFENLTTPLDSGTPVVIAQADQGYGMGTYEIEEPSDCLVLTVKPSSTDVDYTNYPNGPTPFGSILTFTIASGP